MLNWEVKNALFNPDYSITVTFNDGLSGIIKLNTTKLIKVFEPLKDVTIFLQGYIKYGAITWNVGDYELDMALDKMYQEIKNNNGIYEFEK